MTDRGGGWAGQNSRPRAAMVREGRLMFLGIVLVLLVGGGIATFVVFRHWAKNDLVNAQQLVAQLQTDDENQRKLVTEQNVKINKLEAELARTRADLLAIRPEKDRYNLPPNEARIVGDGHLKIGLIGSPSNENVTLSINDKPQTVIAGQQINVAPDASTNCQIVVQSFTMFQAVVTAVCTANKP